MGRSWGLRPMTYHRHVAPYTSAMRLPADSAPPPTSKQRELGKRRTTNFQCVPPRLNRSQVRQRRDAPRDPRKIDPRNQSHQVPRAKKNRVSPSSNGASTSNRSQDRGHSRSPAMRSKTAGTRKSARPPDCKACPVGPTPLEPAGCLARPGQLRAGRGTRRAHDAARVGRRDVAAIVSEDTGDRERFSTGSLSPDESPPAWGCASANASSVPAGPRAGDHQRQCASEKPGQGNPWYAAIPARTSSPLPASSEGPGRSPATNSGGPGRKEKPGTRIKEPEAGNMRTASSRRGSSRTPGATRRTALAADRAETHGEWQRAPKARQERDQCRRNAGYLLRRRVSARIPWRSAARVGERYGKRPGPQQRRVIEVQWSGGETRRRRARKSRSRGQAEAAPPGGRSELDPSASEATARHPQGDLARVPTPLTGRPARARESPPPRCRKRVAKGGRGEFCDRQDRPARRIMGAPGFLCLRMIRSVPVLRASRHSRCTPHRCGRWMRKKPGRTQGKSGKCRPLEASNNRRAARSTAYLHPGTWARQTGRANDGHQREKSTQNNHARWVVLPHLLQPRPGNSIPPIGPFQSWEAEHGDGSRSCNTAINVRVTNWVSIAFDQHHRPPTPIGQSVSAASLREVGSKPSWRVVASPGH